MVLNRLRLIRIGIICKHVKYSLPVRKTNRRMSRRETRFVCDEPHGTKKLSARTIRKALSVEPDGPHGYRGPR